MDSVLYLKTEPVAKDILELSTKSCSGERLGEAVKQYRETLTICKKPALHTQYCQNIFRRKENRSFSTRPCSVTVLGTHWQPSIPSPLTPFLPAGIPSKPKRPTLPFPGQRSGLQKKLLFVLLGWMLSWVKTHAQKKQRHYSHLSQG